MIPRTVRRLVIFAATLLILSGVASCQFPKLAAGAILHPFKRPLTAAIPDGCQEITVTGEGGVTLHGWRATASGPRRGTIIYLHGMADNRASGTGVIERFRPRGFDVIACDSRAHGQSGGAACTYGFFEKQDLHHIVDTVAPGSPVILIGSSLGGAVALQEAADDPRITAIVAAETFTDLRTVATERAPFFFTQATIERAFQLAEQEGHFQMAAVSPIDAARRLKIPVLLIHGAADRDTPPSHTRHLFAALPANPRNQLILVPGATHNHSLHANAIWEDIQRWIDSVVGPPPTAK
jgi:alpha-beta hydrolase superfamily lysophospholipase